MLFLVPFITQAQAQQVPLSAPAELMKPHPVHQQLSEDVYNVSPVRINYGVAAAPQRSHSRSHLNPVLLGTTEYDLQTNASVARRLDMYDNNEMSAVWTIATDASPWNTRGTGYAHFDGNSWSAAPSQRIESERAGWPTIGRVPGESREYVISHTSRTSGGYLFSQNNAIGGTNWTTTDIFSDPAEIGPIWARSAESGDYIYMLGNYSDTSIYVNGVSQPTVYSRYQVSTDTWVDQLEGLPGYSDEFFAYGSGDNYAIDAQGQYVAIVIGGSANGVTMWKSDDYGETFDMTRIDTLPVRAFEGNDLLLDTPSTNDGSVSVVLDNDNNAHVFWGRNRIFDDDPTDDAWSFFPGTNGIVYWTDARPNIVPTVIAGMPDLNQNQQLDLDVSGLTLDLEGGARYGNTTLATHPSAGVGQGDSLYLIFSAPIEDAFLFGDENLPNFRDIWVTFSTDNGQTWEDLQNITQNFTRENVFASMAREVDNSIHILYQEDDYPGTVVQNLHDQVTNEIYYVDVPVSMVVNQELGLGPDNQNAIAPEAKSNFELRAYPNPTADLLTLEVEVTNSGNGTLQVVDAMGKSVYAQDHRFNAGMNQLPLDVSNLKPGVYFYTLTMGNHTVTDRIMVQ